MATPNSQHALVVDGALVSTVAPLPATIAGGSGGVAATADSEIALVVDGYIVSTDRPLPITLVGGGVGTEIPAGTPGALMFYDSAGTNIASDATNLFYDTATDGVHVGDRGATPATATLNAYGAASGVALVARTHLTTPGNVLELQDSTGFKRWQVSALGNWMASTTNQRNPSTTQMFGIGGPVSGSVASTDTAGGAIYAFTTQFRNQVTTTSATAYWGAVSAGTSISITNAYTFYAAAPTNGPGGSVTNQYGLYVEAMTAQALTVGVAIAAQPTQTLWLANTTNPTAASGGIAFGSSSDTVIYRAAAADFRTTGHHTFTTDNTYDVGASGAVRPRTGYFGTSVIAPTLVATVPTGDAVVRADSVAASTDAALILNRGGGQGNARAEIQFQTSGAVNWRIGMMNSGLSGPPGPGWDFSIGPGGAPTTAYWRFVYQSGHLIAATDNTYDIGASGATRPRTGYFGTSVVTPSITSAANLLLGSSAGTHFTLNSGGSTTVHAQMNFNASVSIAMGSVPSTTGDIRLPNNSTIKARNAGNSTDYTLISFNSSDQIVSHNSLITGYTTVPILGFGSGGGSSSAAALFNAGAHAGNGGTGWGLGVITTFTSAVTTEANALVGRVTTAGTAYTLARAVAFHANAPTVGSTTVTAAYGFWADPITGGSTNFGARIDAASTATLWLSGSTTPTAKEGGLTAGSGRDVWLFMDGAVSWGLIGKLHPSTDAGAAQTAAGILAGTGAPNDANGADGDFYFRSDGGALTSIYQRRAGAWVGII